MRAVTAKPPKMLTEASTTAPSPSHLAAVPPAPSTGAAAAIIAAAGHPDVQAVVCRGGRPDLAGTALEGDLPPTLLIVGERDEEVLTLNRHATLRMRGRVRLEIVPGATHLFEEPGTLERAADLAAAWFHEHLHAERRS